MITKFDQLINQIQVDRLKRIENKIDDPLLLNISQLNKSLDKSTNELNGEFLYSQLLIDCLLRMKTKLTDKNELIHFCRKLYENKPNQLNTIKEFEQNYSSDQAIWWYTRESFLYRLLNKALRIQNIDLLFLFRFFIQDIEIQLKQNQCLTSIRVYRGQLMSIGELNQLKNSVGEYISINSFFSTSLNRQTAMKFLNDYSFTNNSYKILFEIDANEKLDSTESFANISSLSFYSNEEEILFMLGSIFRLMSVKQDKNGLWIIQMILSDHNDENLKILSNQIKTEYNGVNEETNLLSFGNLLYQMGKYDLAEKYFHRLLYDLPNDHYDVSRCCYALGILALTNNNYDSSIQWHEKALKTLTSNDARVADSYNCIGCIYQKKEDFNTALEYYNKALIIWDNSFEEDNYQIADCLNNMGCVYETQKNYSKALECHEKALIIRKKCLPKDHSDLGGSYNNIGNVYLCLEQYDLALENYKYSYEIKFKSLPSQHVSLASTLENIGLVYEQKQIFQQAFIYYERAAKIFREIFLPTHNHVIDIDESINRVSLILNSQKISTKF